MNGSGFAGFLALAIPAFFTPGPNNLMLMASGARFGVWRTVPHALGIMFGFPIMVMGAGLGFGAVFAAFPVAATVLKYLAAAYLLWMAWHLVGLRIGQVRAVRRPMRFFEAALFQWVNPKAWAIAASFVAAFVEPGEGRLVSLLWLASACVLVGPFSSILWTAFGQQVDQFLKQTGSERYLGAVLAGLLLIAVVLFLI